MSKKLIAGAGVVASFAIALAPLATFADTLYPNAHQDKLSVTIEKTCSFGYTYTDGTTVAIGDHTDGTKIAGVTADPDHVMHDSKDKGLSYGVWDITPVSNVKPATAYDVDPTTETDAYDTATHSTQGTTVVTDTAYGIMENKTKNENFAKTKLNVICNNAGGYTITAESTDLTSTNLPSITQANSVDETAASTWSFKYTNVANGDSETIADDSANRTVTYGSTTASTWDAAKTKKAIVTVAPVSGKSASTPKKGDAFEITYGVAIDSVQPAGTYEGTITYVLAQTL